jgi:acetyltransferase-like isoleucine patch superfamily enzyme
LRGVKIGKNVWISQMVYIDELHPEAISIGDNSSLGLRTSIFSHFHWEGRGKAKFGNVIIEKNVFIGPHCLILPNVHIGEGAVIKGGTVISSNVPSHTCWASPSGQAIAKVTVPLTPEHDYKEFVNGLRFIKNGK